MKVNHNEIFKYYQKGIYPDYNKIIAIGDIHGDYNAFLLVLIKAKIIDKNNKWIGGNTHVVQIGDILDRKPRNLDKNDDSELDKKDGNIFSKNKKIIIGVLVVGLVVFFAYKKGLIFKKAGN